MSDGVIELRARVRGFQRLKVDDPCMSSHNQRGEFPKLLSSLFGTLDIDANCNWQNTCPHTTLVK